MKNPFSGKFLFSVRFFFRFSVFCSLPDGFVFVGLPSRAQSHFAYLRHFQRRLITEMPISPT